MSKKKRNHKLPILDIGKREIEQERKKGGREGEREERKKRANRRSLFSELRRISG